MCAHASMGIATHNQSQDNTHTHACERKISTVCVSTLGIKIHFFKLIWWFFLPKDPFFSKPHLLMVLLEKQTDRQTVSASFRVLGVRDSISQQALQGERHSVLCLLANGHPPYSTYPEKREICFIFMLGQIFCASLRKFHLMHKNEVYSTKDSS